MRRDGRAFSGYAIGMKCASFARLLLVGLLLLVACEKKSDPSGRATPAADTTEAAAPALGKIATEPTGKPLSLVVVYGSEKKTWLEEQAKKFEAQGPKTPSGRPITIDARAMGSGEAMQAVTGGTVKAHVFSPASSVYLSLVNDAWLSQAGHTRPLVKTGEPLLLSPVVVAMWQPMAESLGWPKKRLSWSDLLKVSTDPTGWGPGGKPEWGRFKFGHTHPEYSNSGFLAVLAEAYAGAKKTRDLSVADLDDKKTQAFISQVEDTIVHYGKSTGFFSDKMRERGPSYLSAAVLYENLVIETYSQKSDMPLVAIYPTDGTFWSDHPYAVIDAEWVGDEERAAADAFYAFLRAKPQQERALSLGFRPGDPTIPIASPIDPAHGVDPKEPQTVLAVPSGKTLARLLGVWSQTKKGTDVELVFDKSGSMRGKPLDEARAAAKSFLQSLSARDEASILFFDSQLHPPTPAVRIGDGRPSLEKQLDAITAGGNTSLYDAIGSAYDHAQARTRARPGQIHALVVMTDGKDEGSTRMTLESLKAKLRPSSSTTDAPVRVFTIAYGDQAESKYLAEIAEAAGGSFAQSNIDTIRQVFVDMASFL